MKDISMVAERNPYQEWIKGEGIPIITGYGVDDVMKLQLEPWRRLSGKGAYLDLVGSDNLNGAYVCEIPPGGTLNPEKHLFEEIIYILTGKGTTSVWTQATAKQTFEWQEGSLFSPPLNSWHQLSNHSGKPARFLAVTGAPVYMNLFHNSEFIFNNDFVFKDRYTGQSDYFTSEGKLVCITDSEGKPIVDAGPATYEKNLFMNVLDAVRIKLPTFAQQWESSSFMNLVLSDNTMEVHIGEYQPGTHMKAHRHDGGAHILMLGGKGYTLMWPDHGQRQRFDWHKGSVVSPPEGWWHTHYFTGTEPAIQLALRWMGHKYRFNNDWRSLQKPNIIDYADEDPELMKMFEAELAKEGLKPKKMEESLYRKKG